MPETAVVTPSAAGASAAGSAGGSAASTSGAGSGAGSGDGGHVDTGAGGEGGDAAPKSFKFSLDENEAPVEFSLEDEGASAGDKTDAEFRFDQLDAIKDTHADLYKTLKAELSKGSRFSKLTGFKSPEEAQAHVKRIDKMVSTIGRQDGKVGLDAVESTITELAHVLNKAQSGDVNTIKGWFKDNPQANQLGEAFASQWAEHDSPGYIAHVAKAAMTALSSVDRNTGHSVISALNALYDIPAVKSDPQAQKLLQRVAATMNGIVENSEYQPDQAPLLKAKEQTINQREQKLWLNETDLEAKPLVTNAARKIVSDLTSQLKKTLTGDERTEYNKFVEDAFYKYVNSDQDFQDKLQKLIKERDRSGVTDLIKKERAKYMGKAGQDLYRQKLLNRKGVRDEAANKQEAGGGTTGNAAAGKVVKYTGKINSRTQAPAVDFDYARMSQEGVEYIDGFFFIKGRPEKFSWR